MSLEIHKWWEKGGEEKASEVNREGKVTVGNGQRGIHWTTPISWGHSGRRAVPGVLLARPGTGTEWDRPAPPLPPTFHLPFQPHPAPVAPALGHAAQRVSQRQSASEGVEWLEAPVASDLAERIHAAVQGPDVGSRG